MQKLQNIWRFEIEEARRKDREFRTFGLDSRGANKQGKIMNGNRMKIGRSFAVSTGLRLDSRRFASLWTQVCGSSLVCRQQWPRRKWRQRVAAIYREPRIPISETFQLGADGVTVNFLFIKLDVSGIPFLFFFPPPSSSSPSQPLAFPFHKFNEIVPPLFLSAKYTFKLSLKTRHFRNFSIRIFIN